MSSKLVMWVPLVVASGISAAYIFVVGVDWEFTFRSGSVPSAIVTGLILSVWASVPYFILLPIARREGLSLITILAVAVILAFGFFSIERGRHMPGDEGGSYIVVPLQQMVIAAVILIGWRSIRRLTS
jgi:hypothetical protein